MITGTTSLTYGDTGDFSITSAATYVGDWVDGFDGVTALTAQLRFAYGSGGTSAVIYLQTSLDGGTTAVDIAAMAVTTASETVVLNFSGLTPKTTQITPTDGALTSDTAVDGVLGDRFRVKVVSVGTYANTVVSARIVTR